MNERIQIYLQFQLEVAVTLFGFYNMIILEYKLFSDIHNIDFHVNTTFYNG